MKNKKFYSNWWFWVIVLFGLLTIVSISSDTSEVCEVTPAELNDCMDRNVKCQQDLNKAINGWNETLQIAYGFNDYITKYCN